MEEKLNAVTHGLGVLLSLVGLVVLVMSAYLYGNIWHIVSFSVYGVSLLLLYVASTLYHSFQDKKLKYIFKIFDHVAIYLLIAGTYTPFTLVLLHGTLGWSVFGVVWGLAFLGILFQIFFVNRFKIISTICYLLLGWIIVVALKPIIDVLPVAGFCWLVAGGLFYSVGAVFYLQKRLAYNHMVWHLFVLAGSISHFVTVLVYVLPISVPI